VLSFDLTFNLIKNTHPSKHKYKVGAFMCTSSCKKLTPVGLVVSLHQSRETYAEIFSTFFKAMGSQPKVLVTDEEKAIRAGVKDLVSTN
jgi:hypothetical protein